VRFNTAAEISEAGVQIGTTASTVQPLAKFCLTRTLNAKGTDASNLNDEEIAPDEGEFSDDEAEMAARASRKRKVRQPEPELEDGEFVIPDGRGRQQRSYPNPTPPRTDKQPQRQSRQPQHTRRPETPARSPLPVVKKQTYGGEQMPKRQTLDYQEIMYDVYKQHQEQERKLADESDKGIKPEDLAVKLASMQGQIVPSRRGKRFKMPDSWAKITTIAPPAQSQPEAKIEIKRDVSGTVVSQPQNDPRLNQPYSGHQRFDPMPPYYNHPGMYTGASGQQAARHYPPSQQTACKYPTSQQTAHRYTPPQQMHMPYQVAQSAYQPGNLYQPQMAYQYTPPSYQSPAEQLLELLNSYSQQATLPLQEGNPGQQPDSNDNGGPRRYGYSNNPYRDPN
jgi:hypothetical protein